MLLQQLVEYADRLEEQGALPPPLYSRKWVRYLIELDSSGRLLNPTPIDLAGEERSNKRGQQRSVPHTTRTVKVQPLLLADHAEYTFGLILENAKPERVKQCHNAYLELLEKCAKQTEDSVVSAVLEFLRNNPLEQLELDSGFDSRGVIIFRVGEEFAHRRPAVQKFWARYLAPDSSSKDDVMECIICGENKPVLHSLKGKIKGIPGGHSVGTAIISANKAAFESYGLKRSLIAPTCMECGDRFTKALNFLRRNDSNHLWFSTLVFIFWTQEPVTDFTFSGWYDQPEPQAVRDLINSVRSGKWNPVVDETAFYAVSLSGSGGRTMIRDWIDSTVGQVKRSLADWFQSQAMISAWGEESTPLSILSLAGATVRDLKDVKPLTYQALLRSGLTKMPLPWHLMQQAVRRNIVEREVTHPRAALIKLVMTTQKVFKEKDMVQLQVDNPDPAYHCGRLLAVLENVQRGALGNINSTVVDRYYGTASTAPASVFGRLLRGAQPHLSKLRRDRPGLGFALQERLEEVLAALPAFPTTLDLKQQGLFALGYYHQRAYDRAEARAYVAQKKQTEAEQQA